jgi:hypothetical protein
MKKSSWLNWILENPTKAISWLIAICALVFYAFTFWMGYMLFRNPMCEKWHEGMTKDEKIRTFLEIVNDEPHSVRLTRFMNITFNVPLYRIPYPDAETILRANPDCCRLYPDFITYDFENMGGKEPLPPDTVLPSGDEGVVMVSYLAYKWQHNGLEKYRETRYQRLNPCKNHIF